MPYVGGDGTVGGRKSTTRLITDFFYGIFNFIGLFFSAITNPPQRIESQSTVRHTQVQRREVVKHAESHCEISFFQYGQRNNGRSYRSGTSSGNRGGGSNIRGVRHLGDASARMGG